MKKLIISTAFMLTACTSLDLNNTAPVNEVVYSLPEIDIYSDRSPWFDLCPATKKFKAAQAKPQPNFVASKRVVLTNSANHCREIDAGDLDANINAKLECLIEVVKGF